MTIDIVLIIFGFILLIKGADFLVTGSSNIAKKFHIPEIIIGLTIVSIGTSMPELFVSITSVTDGYSDLVIGNIIGSNLSNLLLILGISSIIRNVEFQKQTKKVEIPLTIIISIIFFIMCNTSDIITQLEGYILLILFLLFIIYTIYISKNAQKNITNVDIENIQISKDVKLEDDSIIKSIVFIIIGILGLKYGGDFVVDSAMNVGTILGMNEKLISLTIVSIGTSLPELVTSITAALKGDSDIAIGNILGSNIFNMLLILGTTAIILPINYLRSYNLQSILMIVVTIILGIFPYIGKKNQMTRKNGIIYLSIYIIYMITLIIQETII